MKNLMIYALMMILVLQIANAETKIFSGTVTTDTDKVIDGSIFRFKYDENSNKAFVQTPTTNLIVDNGACKSNDIFRVCINRANFSYKNITTYISYYEVNVDIYKLTGSLSATAKSTLTTMLQGESAELTVRITNPTDFDITKIAFNYDMAPFYVREVKGCDLNEKQMLWNGSLKSKYDKTCTAAIVAEKEGTYSLAGNLSYFNGFDNEKKTTDTATIKVLPKQLKAAYIMDKNVEIKKPFYINISLQNIHASEDMEQITTINLPDHISLLKDAPAFDKDARVLKHNSLLKPGNMLNYSLYLEMLSQGKEPINYKYAYKIKGINDVIENNTFFSVGIEPLNKPLEPQIRQEVANDTVVTNVTITKDSVQSTKASNASTITTIESQPDNKTAEKVIVIADNLKSKFLNKKVLKISVIGLIVLAVIVIIMYVAISFKSKRKIEKEPEIKETLEEIKKI